MNILVTIYGVLFSIAWFYIVLKVAKHTVGKDAKLWQILTYLVIAGPLGWATIIFIIAYDLIDRAHAFYEKIKKM